MRDTLSLFELNTLVREAIEQELTQEYWVEAELSEVRESRGHCYMELIQKEELANTPIARASAKCWHSAWTLIRPHFERITGQHLHAGMKVRLKVYAQFHEAFGFSWIVTDIDPNYTLGDLARRRQEIINQLKQEGVFDLQRELTLPVFCQRIAVISSASAAGYGDFYNQLADSHFAFQTTLFPAIMQGEQVEESIIEALNQIYDSSSHSADSTFDCVVIIRGGGATADMSGFDTLALAENVAQFPIPIITGIGHDRDESILDMVSYMRVKTPTAAAAFLIDHLNDAWEWLTDSEQRITYFSKHLIENLQIKLNSLAEQIPTIFSLARSKSENRIEQLYISLGNSIRTKLEREVHHLELLQQRTDSLDPTLLLKRGYSITLQNGKVIRNASQLKTGDEIETRLEKGTIKSIVK